MFDNPKSNQILNTLTTVNSILLREKELSSLLKETTNVLTQSSECFCSWLGIFDTSNKLIHIESSGEATGFDEFKANALLGIIPEFYRKVLSSNKLELLQVPRKNCRLHIENKKSTSFIATFCIDDKTKGLLWVAVPKNDACEKAETNLIKELIQNIGYAVANILEKQDLLNLITTEDKGCVLFNHQLNIISVNQTFCTLFNRKRKYFIGKNFRDVILSFYSEAKYEYLYQALQKMKQGTDIKELEIIHSEKTYKLNTKTHHQSKYRIATFKDITIEKEEQNELKKSDTKYRTLFNAINDAIVIHPLGDKHVYPFIEVNDQACRQFGYSREELLQLTARDLTVLSKNNIRISTENRKRLIKDSWTICELEQQNKNGEIIPVEISSRLFEVNGRKKILSLIRNITERKKLEDKNALLLRAIESSPVTIVITNKDGNIDYVNPCFEDKTGYSKQDVLGKNPRILKSGMQSKAFYNKLWETITSGNNWHGEFHNKKKNGELFWEQASISPITNPEGEIEYYIAIKEDITQKKQTLHELKTAKNKAEESDRLKSAFLANISHEIRTPMNSILSFSDFLLDEDLSMDEKKEYIDIIQTNGKRIQTTINDIIDISKIESGIENIKPVRIDIKAFMADLFQFFKSDAADNKLKFTFTNANDSSETIIYSDEEKLNSILSNLIKNAIKFTLKGEVSLGYSIKNDALEFFVQDTGIGIPSSQQQIIFESFIQADSSQARLFEGAGLGLSITKSYTKALGGTIRFESEENKGSTFYVSIPANNKEEDTIIDIGTNNKVTKRPLSLKILIAEDDPTTAQLLTAILEPISSEIRYTEKGAEAVTILENNPDINLILMDIKLIGLDGFKATNEIRKFNQRVKIIAQTAYVDIEYNLKALEAGCDDFITKPINKQELIQSINNLFE